MKRILFLISFVLFVSYNATAQSMSDEAVMTYVKNGMKQGKSQKQLYNELMVRGVSTSQLQRIKDKYEQQKNETVANKGVEKIDTERKTPEAE